MNLLKVGELARRSGLTVRTLHHYDEIGLLHPSGRSDGGYRLYDAADVARLHAIQALRGLGLPLDEVGKLMADGGASLPAIVSRQLQALDVQIRQATELRERLQFVQAKYDVGGEPALEDWLGTLQLMTTSARYFSREEMQRIFHNWARVEADWQRLVAQIRVFQDAGVPPLAPELQPLAHRWTMLMHHWMDGDFDRMQRWGRMYEAEPSMHGRGGLDIGVVRYIEQAVQLRLSLLLRHLSLDDLRRLDAVPEDEWAGLAADVQALQAQGGQPDAVAAAALGERWLALLKRMSRGDDSLRDRLMRAHDAEPLLRQSAALPPEVRDFLQQALRARGQVVPAPTPVPCPDA